MKSVHNLVAPNSRPIVAIKLDDRVISDFKYSYDGATKTSLYVLPGGTNVSSDKATLLDSDGNEWEPADVEFYSLGLRI